MRSVEEMDHYEVLEVSQDADADEIERAYRLLSSAYADTSLATYSLFDPEDAGALRVRIEEAYRVLSDPGRRASYDALRDADTAGEPGEPDEPVVLAPLAETTLAVPLEEPRPREAPAFDRIAGPEELEEDGVEVVWDGPRLRRARLLRGVEMDDVAGATKVNPAYLRFIEDDRFDDLPALVYVRGFVSAYARFLGLDAPRVARSYTLRYEEHRRAKPRSRLLGQR
jgi:flagellar biosynthesis protein FlhG